MAVIPSDTELDLKALAAASGNRKIHLVPVKELQKLTGYIRGGVTALAAKKTYPVYADSHSPEQGAGHVGTLCRARRRKLAWGCVTAFASWFDVQLWASIDSIYYC